VDVPEQRLSAEMQGTIVEVHEHGAAYEVECATEEGEAITFLALRPEQFVVVWRAQTQAWVSVAERVAEVVAQ
jgi:hypothetical protein